MLSAGFGKSLIFQLSQLKEKAKRHRQTLTSCFFSLSSLRRRKKDKIISLSILFLVLYIAISVEVIHKS